MSSDEFRGKISELEAILEVLERTTKVVESYQVLVTTKTEGYLSAIQLEKSPFADTSFHITNWFRNFIGIKDEAMLLINGEIIRGYHLKFHKQYIHERGNEQRYYTSKTEFLGLSSCCVDGLLYEIRSMERKYKKQMDREGDRVDILSNRVQDIEMRLDKLCKCVDSFSVLFQKELKKRTTHIKSITLEIKHKSENVSVQYHKELTSCVDFSCSGKGVRTGSRKQALYSGIEERNVQTEPTGGNKTSGGGGTFRSKVIVADAEDEADLRERLQQRAQQEELRRQAMELEAAKGPDFGFDFSIDQTKLQAGAFDLMAVPLDPNARAAHDDVGATPGHVAGPLLASTHRTACTLLPQPLCAEMAPFLQERLMKVKVCANNMAVSAEGARHLNRTKLSGTNIVVTFATGSSSSSGSGGEIAQIYLAVSTNTALNFAELKDRSNASCGVSVDDILEDVCRQLWLAAPFSARGKQALDFYFCLPVSVSIHATKYSREDCMQLPSAEDLAEKRYLVKTDDRPMTVLFLSSIAKWLGTFDQEDAFTEVKQQLVSLRPLVQRLCDCLSDPSLRLDLATFSHLAPTASAAVHLEALYVDAASNSIYTGKVSLIRCSTYLEKLLQLAQSSTTMATGNNELRVTISESSGWCACFASFLIHASHLHAAACGLTCVDLISAVQDIERYCACFDSSPSLQVLNLQHNGGLLSYVDHPWERTLCSSTGVSHAATSVNGGESNATQIQGEEEEPESEPMDIDLATYSIHTNINNNNSSSNGNSSMHGRNGRNEDPLERFALCVLTRYKYLRELDLSYCATSVRQAAVLTQGLVAALTARETAGLPPVEKLVLLGLEVYPGVVQELRRRLHRPGTGHMAGVRVIDASSFDFTI